jgi:hypothetical protein
MKKTILVCFWILFLTECKRFQIESLHPTLISEIPIGDETEKINGQIINNTIVNIPFRIPIGSNRLYITDYLNSRIKIYNFDGKLEFIIGNAKRNELKIKFLSQKFNSIGLISVSQEDDIYVQNRLSSNSVESKKEENLLIKTSGFFDTKEIESTPSYILQINNKGKLISILGKNGVNSEPFRYIEAIYSYKKNKIFVYHKFAEQMLLSIYDNGELKGSIEEEKIDVLKSEEYNTKLDSMIPNLENEYALVSVSYFGKKDLRFKFRKIFKYDFNNSKPTKEMKEILYPSEILFHSTNTDSFIIWETENKGDSVKLQIHDKEGNHIKNKRFEFNSARSNWRETYMDEKGNLFSIRLNSNFLELYRWD